MFLCGMVFWRPAKPPCWKWYPARMGSYPWGHSVYRKSNYWVRNSQEYTVQAKVGEAWFHSPSLFFYLGEFWLLIPSILGSVNLQSSGSRRGNGFTGDTESHWALIFSDGPVSLGSSGQESSCHGKMILIIRRGWGREKYVGHPGDPLGPPCLVSLFLYLLAVPHSIWDLSSPTRDRILAP